MSKILIVIRIILISIPIIGLLCLLNWHYGITGSVTATYNIPKRTALISELYPSSRVKMNDADGYAYMVGEPVYFDVTLPTRGFVDLSLDITYKNNGNTIAQLGMQRGIADYQVAFFPLENNVITQLEKNPSWTVVRNGQAVLLQRKNAAITYASFPDFFSSLPPFEYVAQYNMPFNEPIRLSAYTAQAELQIYETVLRGRHELFVYADNEPFLFGIVLQDINRHEGADITTIRLLDTSNTEIWSAEVPDDGISSAANTPSKERAVTIDAGILPTGVYRLIIDADDDIFIKRITTPLTKFVFKDRLYLANNSEYTALGNVKEQPTTVITNATEVSLYTSHASGIQTVSFDGISHEIDTVHEKFDLSFENKSGLHTMHISKNDLSIQGSGYYALTQNNFFYPALQTLIATTPEDVGIQYVVAVYPEPIISEDGLAHVHYNFSGDELYVNEKNKVHFVLSVPRVTGDTPFEIHQISVVLSRAPLTVKSFIQKASARLFK